MHLNEANGTVPLLHIDDSADDRFFVREAISLTKTPFELYEADGMESAVPYFQSHQRNGESAQFPRPALVLLDYDLGNHTGVNFLYWLRLIQKINSIPVIMFSGSAVESQIAECYATGANHCLSKAKDLERLKVIVQALHVGLVLPHRPGPLQLLQEYQPDPREPVIMATMPV